MSSEWFVCLRLYIRFNNFSVILELLPGFNQYFKQWGWSVLLKDTTPRSRWRSNPRPCDQELDTLPTELSVLLVAKPHFLILHISSISLICDPCWIKKGEMNCQWFRGFTWVSVTKENSRTMCAVIPLWWTRSIRTISGCKEADQCSNSDRSSKRVQFNRIDHRTAESGLTDCNRWAECLWSEGLPVWPMPKNQSPEWRKVSGAQSWLSSECELYSSSLPANRLRWSRCDARYAVLEAEWGLSSAGGDLELTLAFFLAGLLWREEKESEETEED